MTFFICQLLSIIALLLYLYIKIYSLLFKESVLNDA